jgi:hypothetical protein
MRYEEVFLCPFCRRRAMGPHDMCDGSFFDDDHPSVVRPLFVELDSTGQPLPEHEVRLSEARVSYQSGGGA